MATAKVFKSRNGQAVRLPKEFHIVGNEVEIFRRGDEIVLCEKPRNMGRMFELLAELAGDGLEERRDDPPQTRKSL